MSKPYFALSDIFASTTATTFNDDKGVSTSAILNGTAETIHQRNISNLLECYNGKYSYLSWYVEIRNLVRDSSLQMANGRVLSSIVLKIKALFKFPSFVIKLYKNRYIGL